MCKSFTKAKKGCVQTEEEMQDRKKQGWDEEEGMAVQTKRRKVSGRSGMTEGQLRELLGRINELEETGEERMAGLKKKLERHVDGLTACHKMEQMRLDAVNESLARLEEMLGWVEGMMRRLEKKVNEM